MQTTIMRMISILPPSTPQLTIFTVTEGLPSSPPTFSIFFRTSWPCTSFPNTTHFLLNECQNEFTTKTVKSTTIIKDGILQPCKI